MLRHTHVIGSHLDHILKAAASSGEHAVKIFPGADELLLRILDNVQFRCSSHLTGTVQCVAELDCWDVTRSFNDGPHRVWNDDFTVRHRWVSKQVISGFYQPNR
ncbi:hypothetical protein D3C84_885690 [compost metagenome]